MSCQREYQMEYLTRCSRGKACEKHIKEKNVEVNVNIGCQLNGILLMDTAASNGELNPPGTTILKLGFSILICCFLNDTSCSNYSSIRSNDVTASFLLLIPFY